MDLVCVSPFQDIPRRFLCVRLFTSWIETFFTIIFKHTGLFPLYSRYLECLSSKTADTYLSLDLHCDLFKPY